MALSKILLDSIDLTGSGNTTTSNIIVTSNTTTSNLLVTGNTTTSNLLVTGNVTVSTSVAVTRNVSTSNIIVSNLATTSNLLVTGNTTTGNLTATGLTTLTGGFTVGATAAPAFSAYQSSAQTLTLATFTKISLQSEEFDTNSNFNNTGATVGSTPAYAFLPTVAGYYQFNAALQVGASASTALITFYKNGSEFKRPTYMSGSSVVNSASGSALIYCNGTSDYVEFYALLGTGQALNATANSTWFQGSMVRSA